MLDPSEVAAATSDLVKDIVQSGRDEGFLTMDSHGTLITVVVAFDNAGARLRELATMGMDADEAGDGSSD